VISWAGQLQDALPLGHPAERGNSADALAARLQQGSKVMYSGTRQDSFLAGAAPPVLYTARSPTQTRCCSLYAEAVLSMRVAACVAIVIHEFG